ncbi:MAG: acyl-CoA thioesterase [Actinomycetota bacterium]|nr:acyl-CoA thioesterase [Actinomycetota bacterium]
MEESISEASRRGPAPASIVVQRRIEWPDTDASGRWHNTAGFRLIEVAETALLERLGLLDDIYGRLPRAHITANFRRLLLFRDVLDCWIEVESVGESSLAYRFEIRRAGDLCFEAKIVAALVDDEGRPETWPDKYKELLLNSGPQTPELLVTGDQP